MYNTPKCKSIKQFPKLNGITAHIKKLKTNVSIGAKINKIILTCIF